MGWSQKKGLLGLGMVVLIVLIQVQYINIVHASTSGGDFIIPATQDERAYYPETILTLSLENLTVGDTYAILIGANQYSYDYQWDNFTADSTSMEREIIHFATQTYLTNQSQPIEYLLIELYDNQSTRLSMISYDLITIKNQINPIYWNFLFIVGLLSLFGFALVMVFVKTFWD